MKGEARPSESQMEYMVNYLDQHPNIVVKKLRKLKIYQNSIASWEKLTNILNNMWDRTVINDVKSWKTVS